ncbi:hypothetical protein LTR64_001148 [Lithohypha guttulata]|uniref:uncharacterized protein n=1 Tax=Lithohypha guttulata TaxID=1690604 RepID=UPI002DDE253F|nr:hypothetical protein LTR51_003342 [Lithohypha guttulata]
MSSIREWVTVPEPDCFQTVTVPSATTLSSVPVSDVSTMNPKQLKQLYNGERVKVMTSENDELVPVSDDYYSLAGLKAGSLAIKHAIKQSGLPDWKIEYIVLPTNDIEAASELLKNLNQSINGGWRINIPRIFAKPISSYKAISVAAHHLGMKSHEVDMERRIRSMLFPNLSAPGSR